MNGENDFADCELAWTSFKSAVRIFNFRWAGMLQGNMSDKEKRIHPTQKPIVLYEVIKQICQQRRQNIRYPRWKRIKLNCVLENGI